MRLLNPYLQFDGHCEETFNFYAQVLGGKIVAMMPHEGTPAEKHAPTDWLDKIIHARLLVGDKMLMGSDVPAERFRAA
jgi:PhnB protein